MSEVRLLYRPHSTQTTRLEAGFVTMWETERCFVSRQNRESGSGNFYCDGNKNIVDPQRKEGWNHVLIL